MPGEPKQFLLLNINLKRQAAFEKELAKADTATGSSAFHGTANENVFRILREGLVVSPELGEVFYSDLSYVSAKYAMARSDTRRQTLRVWKNSAWKNFSVLFGVEVASKNIRFMYNEHSSRQEGVMVRYIFLLPFDQVLKCPTGDAFWSVNMRPELRRQGRRVLPDIRQTYSQIESGDLVDEIDKNPDRSSL